MIIEFVIGYDSHLLLSDLIIHFTLYKSIKRVSHIVYRKALPDDSMEKYCSMTIAIMHNADLVQPCLRPVLHGKAGRGKGGDGDCQGPGSQPG